MTSAGTPRPTLWPLARRYLVALTMAVAVTTSWYLAWLGDGQGYVVGGVALVLLTLPTFNRTWTVWFPVACGLGLAGSLLADRQGTETLVIVPGLLGVIALAELVAAGERLGTIVPHSPRPDLLRLAVTLLAGGAATTATVLLGGLEGPGGLVAVILTAGAGVVLGLLLLNPEDRSPT